MNPLAFFLEHRVRVFPVRMTPDGKKVPNVPKGTSWTDWDDFVRPRPERPYGVVLGSLIVIDADSPATLAWVRANVPPTPFRVHTGPFHTEFASRMAEADIPLHQVRDTDSLGSFVVDDDEHVLAQPHRLARRRVRPTPAPPQDRPGEGRRQRAVTAVGAPQP